MGCNNTRTCYLAYEQQERLLPCQVILRNLVYMLNSVDVDQHHTLQTTQHYNIDGKTYGNFYDERSHNSCLYNWSSSSIHNHIVLRALFLDKGCRSGCMHLGIKIVTATATNRNFGHPTGRWCTYSSVYSNTSQS